MAPLFCPTCVEKVPFSGGEALRCHLARMHFQCLPYPCTSCRGEMKCPTEASLRHHMEFEHGVQEYMIHYSPTTNELFRLAQIDALVKMAVKKGCAGDGEGLETMMTSTRLPRTLPVIKTEPVEVAQEPQLTQDSVLHSAAPCGSSPPPIASSTQLLQHLRRDRQPPAGPATPRRPLAAQVQDSSPTPTPTPDTTKNTASKKVGKAGKVKGTTMGKVKCTRCQTEVSAQKKWRLHHSNTHLQLPLHKCKVDGCSFTSNAYCSSQMMLHFNSKHNGLDREEYVESCVEEHREELEEEEAECFPDKGL